MKETEDLDLESLLELSAQGESWSGMALPGLPADELVGKTLNASYVVESVLGEGGMGRVYRARHTRITAKLYAVKVLHRQYSCDKQILARFQREAEAAATVSHPNVVGVYDVDRSPLGLPYLVCEYLRGIDLSDYLEREGPLDFGRAVHIAHQICDGVEAAHGEGVIHRDLKPQNVFLLGADAEHIPARPHVKLLDFGLSRFLDDTEGLVTRAGVVMGTPAYMAPEQARGERSDHRTDVYGIGAVLYRMVTNHAPFEADSPMEGIVAVINREPRPPRELNSGVSSALESIILRALAKDPERRFQSVTVLREALEAAGGFALSMPPVALPTRPGASPRRAGTRGRSWGTALLLAFVFVTALLFGFGGWLGLSQWWSAGRARVAHEQPFAAPAAASPTATVRALSEATVPPVAETAQLAAGAEASPPTVTPLPRRASGEELSAAKAEGEEALYVLADRYPEDPKVLHALMFSYASRASGLPDAIAVAGQLLRLEPSAAEDRELRYFLMKAAQGPDESADAAFELLDGPMGQAGADLLYELLASPSAAPRARAILGREDFARYESPALSAALELRRAPNCRARQALLPRVRRVGDERAALLLASFARGSRRGCGPFKLDRCPPACPAQSAEFRGAIEAISARLNESSLTETP